MSSLGSDPTTHGLVSTSDRGGLLVDTCTCCGPVVGSEEMIVGKWCGSLDGVHPSKVVAIPAVWFNDLPDLIASGTLPTRNHLDSPTCFYMQVPIGDVSVCWRFQLGETFTLRVLEGLYGDRLIVPFAKPWVDETWGMGPFNSCCKCEDTCHSEPFMWSPALRCDGLEQALKCCCPQRDPSWTDTSPFRRLFVTGRQVLTQPVSGGESIRAQTITGSVLIRRNGTLDPVEVFTFVETERSPTTNNEVRELQRFTFQTEPLCPACQNVFGAGVSSPFRVLYDEIKAQWRHAICGSAGTASGNEVNTCNGYAVSVDVQITDINPYRYVGYISFQTQDLEGIPCVGECSAPSIDPTSNTAVAFPMPPSLNDPIANLGALP